MILIWLSTENIHNLFKAIPIEHGIENGPTSSLLITHLVHQLKSPGFPTLRWELLPCIPVRRRDRRLIPDPHSGTDNDRQECVPLNRPDALRRPCRPPSNSQRGGWLIPLRRTRADGRSGIPGQNVLFCPGRNTNNPDGDHYCSRPFFAERLPDWILTKIEGFLKKESEDLILEYRKWNITYKICFFKTMD